MYENLNTEMIESGYNKFAFDLRLCEHCYLKIKQIRVKMVYYCH